MTTETPHVSALFVHPLKGARPVGVPVMPLDELGALGDRRWMLVDESNTAITPRDVSRLAQLVAALPLRDDGAIAADGPLTLSATGLTTITIPHAPAGVRREVRCWNDTLVMADAGDAAAEWCSNALEVPCRLVHMLPESHRPLQARYAGALPHSARAVSVTDGAPLLLLGEATLSALNDRLRLKGASVLTVDRFRPNVLLAGTHANDEDTWESIMIGEQHIGVGSPCVRCVVTTLDVETLEKSVEPLRTLAEYRRGENGGVYFGMNVTHASPGALRVGDSVRVIALKSPPGQSIASESGLRASGRSQAEPLRHA